MRRIAPPAILGFALLVAACDRGGPEVGVPSAPAPAPAPAPATPEPAAPPHDAPSLDAVRTAHAFAAADEGATCADDRDCSSPLRCVDAACLWPPSMTGDVRDGMPRVVFEGTARASTTYHIEVADDAWERTRGLMHRHSMVRDMGMVFVFDDEVRRTFWMRDTYIPLDMVFVTDAGVVDSVVENATPRTDTTRESAGPARFVVELCAGEVARMGLRPGSAVWFVGLPEALAPSGE